MDLKRKISFGGLTMIAVGSCIGSGIFVTPAQIAEILGQQNLVLLVWILGGITALCGALTFAELGAMYPKAGGVYVFIREAYGSLPAFLYGWITLLVINTGALAALGAALTEYVSFFVPLTASGKLILTASVIILLTAINTVGVQVSQSLSNLFTGLKLAAIAAIICCGIWFYHPEENALQLSTPFSLTGGMVNTILLAFTGVFFSYGGWHHASYLAGETVEPQKTVPRAMIVGALVVTITYVLVNIAYMLFLPLPAIAASNRVAGDALASVFPFGGQIVAVFIGLSIFGTISIYTMSAPRIYYAMAKDGIFFSSLAKVHPRFHTPAAAMSLQALWALVLLLFWKQFSSLITYVTFMDIAFMALAGASVFVLRRKKPQMQRPYKVWGYPVIPWIYTLICSAFVINTLVFKPFHAFSGLMLTAIGYLVYRLRKRIPGFSAGVP
jgi:APA family basic amino acid/polyamine antiporter